MSRATTPPPVHKALPTAEASLRRVMREAGPLAVAVTVTLDDLASVLDELRALRAKNQALWREMSTEMRFEEAGNDSRID